MKGPGGQGFGIALSTKPLNVLTKKFHKPDSDLKHKQEPLDGGTQLLSVDTFNFAVPCT